jgi:hypothetical protein
VLKPSEGGSSSLPRLEMKTIIRFFRAMALKALDQRLANPANTPPPGQPSRPSPQATSTKPETTKTPDESEGGDLGTSTSGQTSR